MTARRWFHFFLFRLLPLLVFGSAGVPAVAQADPPGRVARVNHAQGAVVFSPAGDNEWTEAELNRPLTRGDRLWTDRGSRAEIQLGSSAVRMDGRTHLEFLTLDDQTVQLSVTQGAVFLRVRSLPEGENFEIDTPNVAYRAVYPGDYRIDVDAASGTTRVTIHSGTGAVYGESGQALPLGGGQQITFRARSLVQVNAQESPPQDPFDRWAAERNRQEDQSISARYVPREVVGYQQLDAHGLWTQDATHGMVWYPHGTVAGWAPYRQGHWEWISPWGWTWMDDAPWGFAPFHYGRWAMIESRWAWVPGRLGMHPVYAPALVAFIGVPSGGSWSISISPGLAGVAWFPLAPGEAWQPAYRASPVYISNVNRNIAVQPNAGHAYQRTAEALTVISAEDFHRGRPARGGWLRVAANTLTNAQIVPPPAMPEQSSAVAHQRSAPSQIAPPASAEVRQVIARTVPAAVADPVQGGERAATAKPVTAKPNVQGSVVQQAKASPPPTAREAVKAAHRVPAVVKTEIASSDKAAAVQAAPAQPKAQARREQLSKREQIAMRTEQLNREQRSKIAEQAKHDKAALRAERDKREQQAKTAQQARREQIARRAEQARREQLAQRTGPVKREQAAQRAEHLRLEQLAAREQAKRGQVARRGEQASREQQARKAEQARHEAQAQLDEQRRRETHAQRVEQARRAAEHDVQVLQEQRAAREEHARRAAEREAQVLREQRAQREAQEREQREASQRQQQALSDQARRERQFEQQRERVRRPDLREDRRAPNPEIWQRSIPILAPGRTS